jgi:hypothetical protein
MLKIIPLALAVASTCSCTPSAKSAANEIIQVAVDTCQEIPNFVVPTSVAGSVVGLLCNLVDSSAPAVETIIDSAVWNQLKVAYIQKHGSLPNGMSPPQSTTAPAAAVPSTSSSK